MENTEERGNAYKVLVGISLGNKPFGKHKFMCDDNIKITLKEV